MNLEQLINMSTDLPPVQQQLPPADVANIVLQLGSRLESSPSLEIKLHSINELSALASSTPESVLSVLPVIYRLLATPVTSSALIAASFNFLHALFAPKTTDSPDSTDSRRKGRASFLLESVNGLRVALVQSAAAQGQVPSSPLLAILWLLTESDSMEIVARTLRHEQQAPSFPPETPVAEYVVQLLKQASSEAFAVLDLLIGIPGALDNNTPLPIACVRAGVLEQSLKIIEADKVTTPKAMAVMHLLTRIVELVLKLPVDPTFSLSEEIVSRHILESLGDLIHACSYTLISSLTDKKSYSEAMIAVLSKTLVLVSTLTTLAIKTAIISSKIFEYSVMLVCTPADADFAQKDVHFVALDAARLVLQLVNNDLVATRKLANMVVLSLQPGVHMKSLDVPARLCHMIGSLDQAIDSALYDTLLCLLLEILGYQELSAGCLSTLIDPLVSLYKSSWTDGFKLLARTLTMKAPEDAFAATGKDATYAQFLEYLKQAQKDCRSAIVQNFGKLGGKVADRVVSKLACTELVQCILDGYKPSASTTPAALSAVARCLLSLVAHDATNAQCLAFTMLPYPKTLYDPMHSFLGGLFTVTSRNVASAQHSVYPLTLLFHLLDTVGSEHFFASVSLYYAADPAALAASIGLFITAILADTTPVWNRALVASILASMDASFCSAVFSMLRNTSSRLDSLKDAIRRILQTIPTIQPPECGLLLGVMNKVKENTGALLIRLDSLSLQQLPAVPPPPQPSQKPPAPNTLHSAHIPAALPMLHPSQPPSSIAPAAILTQTPAKTLKDNCTQTDLNVDSLLIERDQLLKQVETLKSELEDLSKKFALDYQPSLFSANAPVARAAALASIFESHTFEFLSSDDIGSRTDVTNNGTTNITLRESHIEIPHNEGPEGQQPGEVSNEELIDGALATIETTPLSTPDDPYAQLARDDERNFFDTQFVVGSEDVVPDAGVIVADDVQSNSVTFMPQSEPQPQAAQPVETQTQQMVAPPVPMQMVMPCAANRQTRRGGRGGIRSRYATGLSEDTMKNMANDTKEEQQL